MKETTANSSREIVRQAWLDQAVWSETANKLKSEIVVWRNRALISVLGGAVLETMASELSGAPLRLTVLSAAAALLGAVLLGVAPYVLSKKASKDQVRAWIRARSASEALKEAIYRHLVRASITNASPAELVRTCETIKEAVSDLSGEAARVLTEPKNRPLELNVSAYVDVRVEEQIAWYEDRARRNAKTRDRFRALEFWFGFAAAVMGVAVGVGNLPSLGWFSSIGPWVAVVTTATAAVSTHAQAARYEHSAMIYYATASRLRSIWNVWRADPNRLIQGCVEKFVADIENAISIENEAWLAEWTKEGDQDRHSR